MAGNGKGALSRILAVLLSLAVYAGCAGAPPVTQSVKFVLFGNTRPDTPFKGFTKSLGPVIQAIEECKPAIIIHTGNSVYGGSDSDGIIGQDVERQMKIFFPMLKAIPTAVYTIPGESDYHNRTLELYTAHSGRSRYYSFNYGTMHFIALNTDASVDNLIDPEQMTWLVQELEESKSYSDIFILVHHAVYVEEKIKGGTRIKNTALMEIFSKYKVRAVFSGMDEKFSENTKDNVKYYIAGCGGYIDKKDNRKKNQFYTVVINNETISITPGKVNIEKL